MSTTPARPALAAPTPLTGKAKKIEKVSDLFNNTDVLARLRDVMPRHLTPERMMRMLATALRTTPKLAECDPMSLLGAVMTCSYVGLEPNTPLGHAYLIPFEKTKYDREQRKRIVERVDVQLIFGYRGLIDLARRGGELVSLHADVVYEGDEFSFEYGSNMHLRHVPMGGARDGRKPIWAYAHAKLKDGEAFEVLPYAQVLKIRDATQGYQAAVRAKEAASAQGSEWKMKSYLETPWVKYEHEMSSKTLIRRIAKMLPMSLEKMHLATQIDGAADLDRIDFRKVALMDGVQFDPSIAIDHSDEEPMGQTIDAEPANDQEDKQPVEVKDAKPAAAEKQSQAQAEPEKEPEEKKPAAKSRAKPKPADDAAPTMEFDE